MLDRRLSRHAGKVSSVKKEKKKKKATGSVAADLRLASSLSPSLAVFVSRYSAARPNCRIFNNDVNERCVSRVRWARPDGLGPCFVSTRARNRPDALPIRLKTNRIFLPAFFFSLSLFLSAKCQPLPKRTCVPEPIPIAHAHRVLVCERERTERGRGPFACLVTLSEGRDAVFFSATFLAGYWTRQMSQRTFSASLTEIDDNGIGDDAR